MTNTPDKPRPLPVAAVMACDVQKASNGLWWMVADVMDCRRVPPPERERLGLGEYTIGLRDWGHCHTFAEVNDASLKYRAQFVAVDANYKMRRTEVYQASMQYKFVPIMGRARENFSMMWEKQTIDPLEGRRGGGKQRNMIAQLMFQSDTLDFKTVDLLTQAIPSLRLLLPSPLDPVLSHHLASTVIVDGAIEKRRTGAAVDDHLFDCLKYILLMSMYMQLLPA